MILPPEYNWLESYLNNDSLWLESALNWEEAFDLALSDFTLYSFLTTPFFNNSYFFIDFFTKISFLDIIMMLETDKTTYSREFYDLFLWDLTMTFTNKFLPLQFFFYTDYQDFITITLYYSPELILVLNDFINSYWVSNVLNYTPSIVFDLFNDSLNTAISEFIEYILVFFSFIWVVVFFVNVFRLIKWNNPLEIYLIRLLNYLFTISKESRTQFEALLQTFFFFFFIEQC